MSKFKPELYGSIGDNTHLNYFDFKCRVAVEPPPAYFSNQLLEDRLNYDKLIVIHGLEPRDINNISNLIIENEKYFDRIYSYDEDVLSRCNNSELFYFGSCWIATDENGTMVSKLDDFYENYYNITDKNFKVSFIKSHKMELPGHKLRTDIPHILPKHMEVYYPNSRIDTKIPLFSDSMFHICVENSKHRNYFTEKIIDCFMSRTIPIYWGCPNISEHFDSDGIIVFDDLDDLKNILDNLKIEDFTQRMDAIENNFNKSKEFAFFFERVNNLILSL